MIRTLAHPTFSFQPALLLPVALTLITIGLLWFSPARTPHIWRVGEDHEPVLVAFHGNEQNETDLFRWSQPQAALFLYGYRGAPALVELRLAAPRQPGMALAQAAFAYQDGDLGTVTVAGYWRRYRLLVPTAITGETVLRWSTEPYIALSDVRGLGIALSGVKQWLLADRSPLSVQIIAWGVLPLLVWMAGVVLRWPVLWRDAGVLLALAPAIGLALVLATLNTGCPL